MKRKKKKKAAAAVGLSFGAPVGKADADGWAYEYYHGRKDGDERI